MKQMMLTDRVKRLRDKMVTTPAICVERALYMTESYKQTENESNVMRRAKAISHILNSMTIRIDEEELFVGNFTSKVRGGAVIPELKGQWLLDEFDTLSTRPFDRYEPLSNDEVKILKEVLPYWQGRAAFDHWNEMVPEKYKKLNHIMTPTGGYCENGHHWQHTAADYEKLLRIGCKGIISEAENKLNELTYIEPDDLSKRQFYLSVIEAHRGLINFAERYSKLAEKKAIEEKDSVRKAELERIAVTCAKVPAEPADSFYEAIQSCWLLYVALMIEGWGAGPTFGRADQYLYPYYRHDIDEGITTDEEVHELLSLIFTKMNGAVNLQSYVVADGKGGHPTMESVCVGGITPDGRDAVNELSYLFLQAEGNVGLGTEDLMVRINKLNPDSYVKCALETAKKLNGKLKFVSDATSIQSMLSMGLPLEKARDYISTGCHNPTVPHFSRNTGGGALNSGLCLELALNNGLGRVIKEQLGPKTGDPKQFHNIEEVIQAYETQAKAGLRVMMVNKHADTQVMAQYPCILLSSLYDLCMERGVDDYNGGTKPYITFALGMIGTPNVADSLAAIKKVIFEDKRATMSDLIDALDNNFEGYEELKHFLDKAPKFGNDDPYVDSILKRILSDAGDFVAQYHTTNGARFATACYAMTTNVFFGRLVGALPDGRCAGLPLSEGGISPYQGRNKSGASATMNSVASLDQVKLALGTILNMRISPDAVNNDDKMNSMVALLRTFSEQGGNLVQFNFASNEVLKAAQKNPELYKDLLVRVATYSAFFVELGVETQNDIINRNELE